MSRTTLLPGVTARKDRDRTTFRCQMRFGTQGRFQRDFDSSDDANACIVEWRRLRKLGLTPASVNASASALLADATSALLARKRVSGTSGKLSVRGLESWERSCKPWLEGEFASMPLDLLRRDRIEDAIVARAAAAATSARNELQALKAVLTYAGERGETFDLAILRIKPIATTPAERVALTVSQLELLAECAPVYARNLVLLLGTGGFRVRELFTLTDDRLDLDNAVIEIPAWIAKERVAKTVPLLKEEVALCRRQLLARAAGTPLVFPTRDGRQWRHQMFYKLVSLKAVSRADRAWRDDHDIDEFAATPFRWPLQDEQGRVVLKDGRQVFDQVTPHDLRSTAATLMREAGLSREAAAARLGHGDSGELLADVYDKGDRYTRLRRALDETAPEGLRAKLRQVGG